MISRCTVFAMLVAAQFVAPSIVLAKQTTLTRQEIRERPILERPSRLGHFYGNSVRRNYGRKHSSS